MGGPALAGYLRYGPSTTAGRVAGARARGTALYLVLASAGWPVVKFCCASIFSSGAPTTRGPVGATFGAEVVQAAQCAGRVGRRSSGTVTTVPWPAAARASPAEQRPLDKAHSATSVCGVGLHRGGQRGRRMRPRQRLSETLCWHTVR